MYAQVKDIKHMKSLTAELPREFALMLKHNLHTRKIISYDREEGLFNVDDLCTGSISDYTETQLAEKTNIVRAIEHGALYVELELEDYCRLQEIS